VAAYGLWQYIFSANHTFELRACYFWLDGMIGCLSLMLGFHLQPEGSGVFLKETMQVTAPYILCRFYIGPTAARAHQELVQNLKQIMEEDQQA